VIALLHVSAQRGMLHLGRVTLAGLRDQPSRSRVPPVLPSARALQGDPQPHSTFTSPADRSCRISGYQDVRGNASGHHTSRPHKRVLSDLDSGQESGSGSNRCALTQRRRQQTVPGLFEARSGGQVIRKDNAGPDEHVILNGHAAPDHDPVLNGHPVAEGGPSLDKGVITDVAVLAYPRSGHDMGECPDSGSLADFRTLAKPFVVYPRATLPVGQRSSLLGGVADGSADPRQAGSKTRRLTSVDSGPGPASGKHSPAPHRSSGETGAG
jgi:hypothetical protein